MALKKTTIPCADVKLYTQEDLMRVGQTRRGALTMKEEFLLQFVEYLPETCERNVKVWSGKHFNVRKNRQGEYMIHFKRLVLNSALDPYNFAEQVFVDVERAKTELGL